MPQRDAVCFSSVIAGLAQNSKPIDALSYFAVMRACGFGSTDYSVSAALEQCGAFSIYIGAIRALHFSPQQNSLMASSNDDQSGVTGPTITEVVSTQQASTIVVTTTEGDEVSDTEEFEIIFIHEIESF
ncbi:hypothetical protein L1987_12335 [Smallanthus sonchifolius]|uniref:Uncharacterized protein n=1 Tax=Smallanthus sonchifolius TaxID=185202 RepID=A0ACB9JED0_9ASTR|nr:hypothetical protein L1987_12335 [Smallanthus sonchifolius]